ncbi:MAG: DUF177 domain-containing protein [Dorea sp.]|jgi:uncharacterized protein|nr:DUF177 domain-containing protein [Dorea sp.]
MILNLSGVLSEQHEPLEAVVPCEMKKFRIRKDSYPVISKEDVHIRVEYAGKHKLFVKGRGRLVIGIPCDRCLVEVPAEFELDFEREVESQAAGTISGKTDELDENNYIDGYHLDVDRLLYNEILVGWPMKVLCSESCKGICNVCGQNLNKGTCDCEDTGIDPRMSVIRDVFKNFKEV